MHFACSLPLDRLHQLVAPTDTAEDSPRPALAGPQEGVVEDTLVVKIKDNPTPVVFPLSVIGAKPQVHVRLDDGTPGPLQAAQVGGASWGPEQ